MKKIVSQKALKTIGLVIVGIFAANELRPLYQKARNVVIKPKGDA
ncbi:MAG: hypothetical protein WC959_07620 [Kiritimatiellales bacterium]